MSNKIKKITTGEVYGNDLVTEWWNTNTLAEGTIAVHNDKYLRVHDGVTPNGTALPLSGAGKTDQVGDKTTVYSNSNNELYFSDNSVDINNYNLSFTPVVGDYIITAEGKRLNITNVSGGDPYTFEWEETYYVNHDTYTNQFFPITFYSSDYAPSTTDKAEIIPDPIQHEYYDQAMKIYGGGPPANIDQNHVHMAGKNGNVELFLGTDNNFVSTKEAGDVPGRVRLKSETDVAVDESTFSFRRHGSWIMSYGDDENLDVFSTGWDLQFTVVDVDKENGDVYAAGHYSYGNSPMVMKLDRNGAVLWRRIVPDNAGDGLEFSVSGIAYDRVNNVVGITTEASPFGPFSAAAIHEFDAATGDYKQMMVLYDDNNSQSTYPMDIMYNSLGKPVVVGYTYGDPAIFNNSGAAVDCYVAPHGSGAIFDISADGLGNYAIDAINNGGTGYSVDDLLRVPGGNLNGSDYLNDAYITVTSITGNGTIDGATISGFSADEGSNTFLGTSDHYLIDNNSKEGIIVLQASDFDTSQTNGQRPGQNPNWFMDIEYLDDLLYFTQPNVGFYKACPATGGTGSNALFDITVDYNSWTYSASIYNGTTGVGFTDGDILTIPGKYVGGTTGLHDVSVTVAVTDGVIVGINLYSGTPAQDYYRFDMTQWGYYNDFSTLYEGRPEKVILYYYASNQRAVIWTPDWKKNLSNDNQDSARLNALDIDEDDNIYVVGNHNGNACSKIDKDGNLLWTVEYDVGTLTSVAWCGNTVCVADNYGIYKSNSFNGYTLNYISFQNGNFNISNSRIDSFRENGRWYVYVLNIGVTADWYVGQDQWTAKLLRKIDVDNNALLWARQFGTQYYDNSNWFYDWAYDNNDYEQWFAVGPYGAVNVGGGYWYNDNYYNAIALQISTADSDMFEPIDNPRVFIHEIQTGYPGAGIYVVSPDWADVSSSTHIYPSTLTTNTGYDFDWSESHEYRIIHENLNKSHYDLVAVEGIKFAHGGTLRHNPVDIPPAEHDFSFYGTYYLENTARGKFLRLGPNSSSDAYIEVPSDDVEYFPVGSVITLVCMTNSRTFYISGNTDWDNVNIYAAGQSGSGSWQFTGIGTATLMKTGSNEWLLTAPGVTTW